MAAGERLDAVQAALLAAQSGGADGRDDARDVVLVHLAGERTVQCFAARRRGYHRQPVVGVSVAAPAEMGDLAHQRRAVAVHALGKLLQIGDARVVADIELPEGIGAVRRDVRRAAEHRERDAALRFLLVVALVACRRHAAVEQAAGMARAHDPVLERQMLEPERPKQGVDRAVAASAHVVRRPPGYRGVVVGCLGLAPVLLTRTAPPLPPHSRPGADKRSIIRFGMHSPIGGR